MCAAPPLSFVCTQSHRELTHSPYFVSTRKQYERELWTAATGAILSLFVTQVKHHRARGGSCSGDGVGGNFFRGG